MSDDHYYGQDDARAFEQEDQLTPQEEAAVMAFAVILTDGQLGAVLHFFAHELARRMGVTGPETFSIPINSPDGPGNMIVLPGGKL